MDYLFINEIRNFACIHCLRHKYHVITYEEVTTSIRERGYVVELVFNMADDKFKVYYCYRKIAILSQIAIHLQYILHLLIDLIN